MISSELDELACLRDKPKLEAKLEELRRQAMAEAIPYDLFLRVEERVRAVLGA